MIVRLGYHCIIMTIIIYILIVIVIVINYNICCGLNSLHQTVMVNWLNCVNIPIEVRRHALEGLSPKTVLVTEDIKKKSSAYTCKRTIFRPNGMQTRTGCSYMRQSCFPQYLPGGPSDFNIYEVWSTIPHDPIGNPVHVVQYFVGRKC